MYKLLFNAPFDFEPEVMEEYKRHFDMDTIGQPVAWVPDPNMNYVIDANVLQMYPLLKVIATPSTGTNHIDLKACKERNVKVLSLLDDRAGLETISASAEFTFKLLLDALRMPPAHELQGKQIGIIGLGRIGRRMAKWCMDFGATIEANDPHVRKMESYPLKKIFLYSDAVIVSCTLTEWTKGMVTEELLRSMQPGAALVNTSRGEVIDEEALLRVMKDRPDLRVALDVVVGETTGTANRERLREAGAIVTPHIAGCTLESRTKAAIITLALLRKELEI